MMAWKRDSCEGGWKSTLIGYPALDRWLMDAIYVVKREGGGRPEEQFLRRVDPRN
jgi:hypothetical protein